MTKHLGYAQSCYAFNDWLNRHPELDSIARKLSISDIDLYVHKYSSRQEVGVNYCDEKFIDLIMLVEVKTNQRIEDWTTQLYENRTKKYAQRDTLNLFAQVWNTNVQGYDRLNGTHRLKFPVKEVEDLRFPEKPKRYVKCCGAWLLLMSGHHPGVSEHIWWNKKEITEEQLVGLLDLKLDPRDPTKELELRRHKSNKEKQSRNLCLL